MSVNVNRPAGSGEVAPDGSALNAGLGGMLLQCFKLVSTRLAEWLKRIISSGKSHILKLFPRHVTPEILLEDVLYCLICGGNYHVGRYEPDAIVKRVNLKKLRGVIERVVQSVNGQLRALGNKLAVE